MAKFQRVTNLRDIFLRNINTYHFIFIYAKTYEINTKALERKVQEKWRHFVQGVDYLAIV